MIIGLGPEYNYPNNFELWKGANNTRYASNHGASLISRTLIKHFNGEYVDEFSDIQKLNKKYDRCIIAFATHLTNKRDVSVYADFLEKLKLPVFLFSLGMQDGIETLQEDWKIHPSMKRVLNIVSDRSHSIGCRGPHTAEMLGRAGFKNVAPIGCPSMYFHLDRNLKIVKKEFHDPAVVFHRTIYSYQLNHLLKEIPLIGQDFLDEVVFKTHDKTDNDLKKYQLTLFNNKNEAASFLALLQKQGVFHYKFTKWYEFVTSCGFIWGPRLHGCVAAIINGIPAVFTPRDLRMREIAEMYNIPHVSFDDLVNFKTVEELFKYADYSRFNETYSERFDGYVRYLQQNGLDSELSFEGSIQ